MIFASPLPDVEIPDVALTGYVLARAAERGDQPAFVEGSSGRTVTYAELDAAVRSLAGGLVAQGFAPGEVVALMSPNLPEFAVVFHGVAMAGGVVTTINPTYTAQEVHKQLVDSGATILVTVPMFLDTARAGTEATSATRIVVIGEAVQGTKPLSSLMGEPLAQQVPVDPGSPVALPYSSGTTGVNKGVMLSHRNLVANVEQVLMPLKFGDDEVFMCVLPMFHIYAMEVVMNLGFRAGATIVTMPRFDLEEFLRLHQEYGITRSFVAPPIVVALAKHPIVDNFDLSSLRQVVCAAAPLSAELALEAGARLGLDIVQGYGMTELSPASHFTPNGQFKPGSVGVTLANTQTRIVDVVTQQDLGIDQDGEVWVKGPQVMLGYLGNEKATSETIDDDGWLHTGDIGHIDSDGHLWIADRLKELIKYNGFQVPPAELEALLLTHPAVADAAVVGRPDDSAGEIPVAFVVLKPGSEATAEQIQAHVAKSVANYKQVRKVVFTDSIPKSASGKILRRLLKPQA